MWLTYYDSAGKVLSSGYYGFQSGFAGITVPLQGAGSIEITQNGTYRLDLKNVGTEQIIGIITPAIQFYRYTRPYFYWGVVGLLIASAYPAFALFRRIWG